MYCAIVGGLTALRSQPVISGCLNRDFVWSHNRKLSDLYMYCCQ